MTPAAQVLLDYLNTGATGCCSDLADACRIKRTEAYYGLRELEALDLVVIIDRPIHPINRRTIHVYAAAKRHEAPGSLTIVQRALRNRPFLQTFWVDSNHAGGLCG